MGRNEIRQKLSTCGRCRPTQGALTKQRAPRPLVPVAAWGGGAQEARGCGRKILAAAASRAGAQEHQAEGAPPPPACGGLWRPGAQEHQAEGTPTPPACRGLGGLGQKNIRQRAPQPPLPVAALAAWGARTLGRGHPIPPCLWRPGRPGAQEGQAEGTPTPLPVDTRPRAQMPRALSPWSNMSF